MTKEEKPGPGGTGGGRGRFDVQDGKGVHCSAYERGDVVGNLESVTDKSLVVAVIAWLGM